MRTMLAIWSSDLFFLVPLFRLGKSLSLHVTQYLFPCCYLYALIPHICENYHNHMSGVSVQYSQCQGWGVDFYMVSHIRMELLRILGCVKFVLSNSTSASSLRPYGSSFRKWKKKAVFRCNLVIFRFSGLESQYVEKN